MSDRKIPLIAAIVAAGALFASAAEARSHVDWAISVNAPGVSTVVSDGYVRSSPVYYQPAPVYYQPAPVVYRPAPVYYNPPPVVVYRQGPAWGYGHHHHHGWRNDGWDRRGEWRDDDHRGPHGHRR